ncbi:MAG TPA: FliM/FliN family flagellar motor C-terminal domain-containing protein [Terracidiphilus sp.]|nr:FliM/FliN family flagellar motor C-terminal domain-containing protein [Terracidiphilus sp.]
MGDPAAIPRAAEGAGQMPNGGGAALIAQSIQPGTRKMDAKLDRLPVQLDVAIPLSGFRLRNLLALEPGQVVQTEWVNGDDLPLFAGEVQLAWSEFEVIDTRLAVRVTRLA